MPTGYQRQSVASIVNGNTINASDFNNEYNALLAAFNLTTGHIHDGTTVGGGAPILAVNGVSFPSNPSTNTVGIVTAANTITYEAVPNAALANSSITLGTTGCTLGSTYTSLSGLSLSTLTLSDTVTATGATITGGTFSGGTLAGYTTSGTFVLGGAATFTGQTITGGSYIGVALDSTSTGVTKTVGTNNTTFATTAFTNASINAYCFQIGNNLSEGNATTMRSNLGLGTSATHASADFQAALGFQPVAQLGFTSGTQLGLVTDGSVVSWYYNGSPKYVFWDSHNLINVSQLTNNVSYVTPASPTFTGTTTIASENVTGTAAFSGTITVPTQVNADSSTKVASTAFVANQFISNKVTTGLMQAGNNQPYIQWGRGTTNGSGNATITFSTPYTGLATISVTPRSTGVVGASVQTSSETATGFTVNTAIPGSGAVATDFWWMAIGY